MDGDEDNEEKDGFGLDKDSRLVALREQRAADNPPAVLDPPFPFSAVSFDPNFV
jgi:hypothetical protein